MKLFPSFLICMIAFVLMLPNKKSLAQVAPSDSLVLVELYNSTNGFNWTDNANWLSNATVSTWAGVELVDWNGIFRVSEINLAGNNVTGTIPSGINNLQALERFDLFTNEVGGAFPNINSLDRLVYLDLGRNNFTSIGTMPSPFNVLEIFYCDENQLTDLPDMTGLDDLTLFWCNDNQLTFEDIGPWVGVIGGYQYAPQANLDPRTIYINAGSFINLFIFVDNYPNLNYEWFFGGASVHNGTFYGISNLNEFDSGLYTIDVTQPGIPGLTITGFINLVVLFQDNNGTQFDPHQFMVQFVDNADPASITNIENLLLSEGAFKVKDCMCGDKLQLWGASTSVQVEERRQTAEDQLDVDSTGTNYVINILPVQEGMGTVTGWIPPALPAGSADVRIAVIDTGIDPENNELKDYIWNNFVELPPTTDDDLNCYVDDIKGYDFFNGNTSPRDVAGHGTHVAGLILRDYPDLVIPELMNLKVHDGDIGFLFDAACAMRYAIDKEAEVMNLSFGYYGSRSYILESAVNDAEGEDILLVASAGNGIDDAGVDTDFTFHWPSSFENDNLITVAALNPDLDDLATYSNFGFNAIDIAAPGSLVESTHLSNGFEILSGTSMATGFVSRTASVIRGMYPGYSAFDTRACILNSVDFTPNLAGKISTEGQLNHDIALIQCLIISTDNIPAKELNTYPQPFSDFVVIELPEFETRELQFEVYNSLGQLVFRKSFASVDQIEWNGKSLNGNSVRSGLYPFSIGIGEKKYSGRLIRAK